MKGMILAAGLGTRLRPVTSFFAKPAVPFLNIPLLYYSMALLEKAGVTEFVINSHYLAEQIKTLALEAPGLASKSVVKFEPGAPLGSGGGVWNARSELIGASFWLANGDEVILPREAGIFARIQDEHRKNQALATIVVMEHAGVGTQFGGVWATPDGEVRGFGKTGTAFPGTRGFHYIGLQLLDQRVFNYLPEGESNILYDALTNAILAGERVQVVVGDFAWFETGNSHDFLKASVQCLELLRHPAKAQGADRSFLLQILERFSDQAKDGHVHWGHPSTDSAIVLAADSAQISSSVVFKGAVTIGPGVKIRAGAQVSNSVLLDGAEVLAGAVISDAIVLRS